MLRQLFSRGKKQRGYQSEDNVSSHMIMDIRTGSSKKDARYILYMVAISIIHHMFPQDYGEVPTQIHWVHNTEYDSDTQTEGAPEPNLIYFLTSLKFHEQIKFKNSIKLHLLFTFLKYAHTFL